ncbi:MAG: MlaD family protein [Thermodesulfovibrio sp.]|nr:MlaD family protein [Thermodesulfovibrio sp.]
MFDRKKQIKWGALKVGLVFTVTLLIVFLVIIFSGGIQALLQKREQIEVRINDVKGLRKGAPVRVAGVDVGYVKDIKLHKDFGTVVKVSLNKEILDYLKVDAKASVQTIGLLGDKYLEIIPGDSSTPFDPSKAMYGYPQTEIRDIVGVATSTINRIDSLIYKVDILITDIMESKGSFSKLINDPSLYDNLNTSISELKKIIEDIRTGSLGMLSKDKELYQKLSNTIKNFEEVSNKLSSSQGSLGKLINEPDLYENLIKVSQRLDKILQELDKSEGTISMLLRDKQTAEDLRQSVREIKELIEEIKKNPKKFFKFSVF